jgi:hypothetical protein
MMGENAGGKEAVKIKTRQSTKRKRLSVSTDITTSNIHHFL